MKLNVKHKTIKPFEKKKIGENPEDLEKAFFYLTPKAQSIKGGKMTN